MTEALINKYRPRSFDDVVGQDPAVRALARAAEKRDVRAFLLVGPSGTGKTTLARITAAAMGCAPEDVEDVDAATHTGVDDMRSVTAQLIYRPMGGGTRAIVVDECFSAGSLVDTPTGGRPIELLRPGDVVLGALGAQTISRVLLRRVPLTSIVRFTLEGGQIILCSGDHPFLTPKGWRSARSLHGKAVLSQESAHNLSPQLLVMWDAVYEQRRWCSVLRKLLDANLCSVWWCVRSTTMLAKELLLQKMWECVGWSEAAWFSTRVLARGTPSGGSPQSAREAGDLGTFGRAEFGAYAAPKSDACCDNSSKDDRYQGTEWYALYGGRNNHAEGREWTWSPRASAVVALAYWWGAGICRLYGAEARARWLAIKLQVGYRISRTANWFRIGRWFSLQSKESRSGSIERPKTFRAWVDRPSVEELRGLDGYRDGCTEIPGFATFYDLEVSEHPSFSVGGVLAHNCHMLSKSAWNSLLKILEEPPDFVAWFLCTTEPTKVPATIVTRCLKCELKPVPSRELEDLLFSIAEQEEMFDGPEGEKVLQLCARQANGSPRQAIANMAACAGARSLQEARDMMRSAEDSAEAVELARALVKGARWSEVRDIVQRLGEVSPESVRHVVRAYVTKVVVGARTEDAAGLGIEILDAFSEPFHPSDGIAPILVACGRVVLR